MDKKQQIELRQLLASLCDGVLSQSEVDRLESLLNESDQAINEYIRYVGAHSML